MKFTNGTRSAVLILALVAVTIAVVALLTVKVAPARIESAPAKQFVGHCNRGHPCTPAPSVTSTPTPTASPTAAPSATSVATPPAGFTFRDDFDGTALDATKWWRETRWDGDVNHQPWCVFSSDSRLYSVSGGYLTLSALRVNAVKPYICPIVSTRGKFGQVNGIFRARIKWDRGHALWPAFWLHNEPNTVDEIDPMEAYPEPDRPNFYQATTHWVGGQQGINLTTPDADFHVYEVEWRGTTTTYRRDGVTVGTVTGPIAGVRMFPILQIMVGVWWNNTVPDATTPNQPTMTVDWVEVLP